jgi:LEA14-like dessication related protein
MFIRFLTFQSPIQVRRWIFILLGVLTLSGQSCKTYEISEFPTIERITRIEPGNFNDGKLDISFTTEIKNPARFKFKVRRIDLDVFIDDTQIGTLNSNRVIDILRLQNAEVKWNLTGDVKALIKPEMLINVFTGKTPQFRVDGKMVVSKFIFRKTIPVHINTPIKLPQLR